MSLLDAVAKLLLERKGVCVCVRERERERDRERERGRERYGVKSKRT